MAPRRFEPVSDLLGRVLRGLAIEREVRAHSVETVWERAVGERLAQGTRPAGLKGGQLLVEARSAAWMNEAALLREGLRAAVNRELGGEFVRTVRFRMAAGFASPAARADPRPLDASDREVRAEEERLAGEGPDGAAIVARARALARKRAAGR